MKKILEFLIHPELRPNRQIGRQTWIMKYSFIYIVYLFALISIEINDHPIKKSSAIQIGEKTGRDKGLLLH